MKDRPFLSVTQILDDSTDIWANDLCDFSIHCGALDSFLKAHKEKGAEEICKYLDFLKKKVMEEYLPDALNPDGAKERILRMSQNRGEQASKEPKQ